MTTPKRIQLRRTKGWRKPPDAIVVARPTKWGNPYAAGDAASVTAHADGYQAEIRLTPQLAVLLYADLMETRVWIEPDHHPEDRAIAQAWRDGLAELRGHDLACWCPPGAPCHADVLLDLANR